MQTTTPLIDHLMYPQASVQNIYWSQKLVPHQFLGKTSLDILQIIHLRQIQRYSNQSGRGIMINTNSPVVLSSNLMEHFSPLATTFSRPVQFGSAKFQSAALKTYLSTKEMRA